MRPAAGLLARLGLQVRDLDLFQQALIHSSYLHEHRDLASGHNERLEFLGDSVVSLAISDALYRRHPDDDEGVLSARRASIVSTAGLARLAARIELGEYLLLGEGEALRGGRRRPALLASAFEAMVGAVYLDGGYEAAGRLVVALAEHELTSDRPVGALKSPKSRLQEFTQRLSGERPQYRLLDAVGPDHDKTFRVEVAVAGRVIGLGEGRSRRLAETAAAAQAIEVLRTERGDRGAGAETEPELEDFATPEDISAAIGIEETAEALSEKAEELSRLIDADPQPESEPASEAEPGVAAPGAVRRRTRTSARPRTRTRAAGGPGDPEQDGSGR